MKLHRFFGDFLFTASRVQSSDPTFIHQLKNVLRVEIGEEVLLCDGKGREAIATLTSLEKNRAEFEIVKLQKNKNEPERMLTLYCAILKRENFEWVAQKATEIGVKTIVPIRTAYTVKLDLNRERIQKIIKESAEQSGRGVCPELSGIMDMADALTQGDNLHEEILLLDVGGNPIKPLGNKKNIGLFVGPEGGWSVAELEQFRKLKCKTVSLGPLTLRAETAAIIGSYIIIR